MQMWHFNKRHFQTTLQVMRTNTTNDFIIYLYWLMEIKPLHSERWPPAGSEGRRKLAWREKGREAPSDKKGSRRAKPEADGKKTKLKRKMEPQSWVLGTIWSCQLSGATIIITRDFPWWFIGYEPALQCRGHMFNPWSGNWDSQHTMEQLNLCATTEPEP